MIFTRNFLAQDGNIDGNTIKKVHTETSTKIRCYNVDFVFVRVNEAQDPENTGCHPAQVSEGILINTQFDC